MWTINFHIFHRHGSWNILSLFLRCYIFRWKIPHHTFTVWNPVMHFATFSSIYQHDLLNNQEKKQTHLMSYHQWIREQSLMQHYKPLFEHNGLIYARAFSKSQQYNLFQFSGCFVIWPENEDSQKVLEIECIIWWFELHHDD